MRSDAGGRVMQMRSDAAAYREEGFEPTSVLRKQQSSNAGYRIAASQTDLGARIWPIFGRRCPAKPYLRWV